MDGPPSIPPRRNVVQRTGAHLHKRTLSKVTLMLSPPTPPHGDRSTAYRIVPESPSISRVMSPPSKRSGLAQISWGPGPGAQKQQGGFWTRRKVYVLVGLALVVLLVAPRGTSTAGQPWWRDHGEREQATYGRENVDKASPRVPPAEVHAPPEPQYYPAPPNPPPGARPHPPVLAAGAAGAHTRFRKVAAKPAAPPPGPPSRPSHDLEVTSATDPETSRRFLLVGWMGEQETKAQQHLYQLGLLALALNRTLVLPNVKRSRFGTCYQLPFSLYYAEDSLARFDIPYITSDDFWAWTDRQRTAPSAQSISFVRGKVAPIESFAFSPQRLCLADRNLDFSEFEGKAFFSPSHDWKSVEAREQYGIDVVHELLKHEPTPSGDENVKTPAVLVAQFNLRYPFLAPAAIPVLSPFDVPAPSPYAYFDYSSHWTALGESIAASLSPFVAVHWRTETLAVDTLLPCGEALIATLEAVKREHPEIHTVYLATDYPIEVLRHPGDEKSATAHSGTMTKTLTPGHHAAMRAFLAKLEGGGLVEGEGGALRITTFMEEQARITLPPDLQKAVGAGGLQDVDGAIVGIVDKIVLQSAELFYAGLPVSSSHNGCAKLSQFTTQIISGRHGLRARGGDAAAKLWNEVAHFSRAGGGKR